MEKFNENIDQFLSGKLKEKEAEDFLKELSENDDKLEKVAEATINEYGKIKLKNKLKSFDKEIKASKQNFKMYGIAAIMIIALSVPLIMNLLKGSVNEQELFSEYFSPYKTTTLQRGDSNDELLANAFISYSNGNYKKAADNFEKVQQKSHVIHFYLALSYLSLTPPEASKAVSNLDEVLAKDNDFHQQAKWYKALALLYLKKKEKAKELLAEIVSNNWFNSDKARIILDKL